MYPPEWFALQLRFAERAAVILGLSPDAALLRCTNYYVRLGLGFSLDPAAPRWDAFRRGLRAAAEPAVWAAEQCRERPRSAESAPPPDLFGPFRYEWVPDEGRIRLHFGQTGRAGPGPLSAAQRLARHAELRALFAAVATRHPAARTVRGNSWLHGIAAYRRLFPPAYGASALPSSLAGEFPYLALWGQFLDHRGVVKAELAARFLAHIEAARTLDDLTAAFPHPVYEVECAIGHFYDFYGVGDAADRPAPPRTG